MARYFFAGCVLAIQLAPPTLAGAQIVFDFEGGIDGWMVQGNAFEGAFDASNAVTDDFVIDESSVGHLIVDRLVLSAARPSSHVVPVLGLADYHTHPMSYLAFGALNGVRTIWGVPGGAFREYVMNPRLVDRDMPPCTPSHGGGLSAETFINGAQAHFVQHDSVPGQIWDLIRGLTIPGYFLRHARRGSPTYADYPGFRHGLHHQMHVTQIRRAWEGGLRLMTAIAVQNVGVEFIMSKLVDGVTNPSTERQVLDAQVCATRQLAELNQDWMQSRDLVADIRRALFSSAEHFLQTWEKVERVSGAPKQDWFSPLALPCEVICRGLCPASPDAGAPHRR